MKKLIMIIIVIFIISCAEAWSAYLQMIDGDGDNQVTIDMISNYSQPPYYIEMGVAPKDDPDNKTALVTGNWAVVNQVFEPGVYDVYLYDGTNYYWFSDYGQGVVFSLELTPLYGEEVASLVWDIPNLPIDYASFIIYFEKGVPYDKLALVPIPPAILLFGSGVFALGLLRRQKKRSS